MDVALGLKARTGRAVLVAIGGSPREALFVERCVLALLPGYQVNRRFMEQMMGVKESLPEALAADVTRGLSRGRLLDALHLTRTVGGLVVNHLTLDRRIDVFYLRLEHALATPAVPLETMRLDELVAVLRERAAYLGGTLTLATGNGGGAVLTVILPKAATEIAAV